MAFRGFITEAIFMNGGTLRYGFIGGGFITQFHLRAIREVRGIEVAVRHRDVGDA